jgi:hypothetical protein
MRRDRIMGWPKKSEGARIYRDRDSSYLMIFPDEETIRGDFDAIGNIYHGSEPSLAGTMASRGYVFDRRLKRVQWNELPEEWQVAFTRYIQQGQGSSQGDEFRPEDYRGLWRMGQRPGFLEDGR